MGIILNTGNTIAYIGNNQLAVTTCMVTNGYLHDCGDKIGGGNLIFDGTNPNGVALNKSGSILYLTTGSGVYGCSTSASTTASYFESCFVAKDNITSSYGITINATYDIAYITNNSNSVYICPINQDGTFGNCTVDASFSGLVNIALS